MKFPARHPLSRRDALAALAGAAGWALASDAWAGAAAHLGSATPFSFEAVAARAQALAAAPFRPRPSPPALAALDYDAMGQIRFRQEAALFTDVAGADPVEMFHEGRYAREPVAIHVVENGRARRVLYSEGLFDEAAAIGRSAPAGLGFAGFRVLNRSAPGDWLAFQGAAYFRSSLPFNQYGLSARGVAIDTAVEQPEEFPAFTDFWLEQGEGGVLVVSALLDGPSVAGAYRITNRKSAAGLTQEIETVLSFRRTPRRLGLAPLTSMYWYGQPDRSLAVDWRPQIHDSDGLALWTGAGERIWRPLANPPRVITNTFLDHDPRGFGLMQRDRSFADYQDDGVFYDRRPSAWIEPIGAWGAGSVQLVEIPTAAETDDNIVAFWTPARAPGAGETLTLKYRVYWCDEAPAASSVARVVATRAGVAGRPGQTRIEGARRFVIDFEGGRLGDLTRADPVVAVAEARPGPATNVTAYPIVGTRRWRLSLEAPLNAGNPTDFRAFLRLGEGALTETWIYQAFGETRRD